MMVLPTFFLDCPVVACYDGQAFVASLLVMTGSALRAVYDIYKLLVQMTCTCYVHLITSFCIRMSLRGVGIVILSKAVSEKSLSNNSPKLSGSKDLAVKRYKRAQCVIASIAWQSSLTY